jgi:four helix bundle protein
MSIVIEEIDESAYWLEFIIDEKLLTEKRVLPLLNEAHELTKIFVSARKTIQCGKLKS